MRLTQTVNNERGTTYDDSIDAAEDLRYALRSPPRQLPSIYLHGPFTHLYH